MPIILLRHASAGSQETWHGDDTHRPLDGVGRQQAAALAEDLRPYGVGRIVSSPQTRCVETVEPLAERLALPVEERDEIADGAPVTEALALLKEVDGDAVVLVCTHRSVITDLIGPERPCRKGAAWILETTPNGFAPAVYLQEP
jgi:phosphohistidine phosphatase SixA